MISYQQNLVAKYLYDPFGTILSKSGWLADANTYRFSSKEWHTGSTLYYYGYRLYSLGLQRWVNRDSIGEWGGNNLYTLLDNRSLGIVDRNGLDHWIIEDPGWIGHQEVGGDNPSGGYWSSEFGPGRGFFRFTGGSGVIGMERNGVNPFNPTNNSRIICFRKSNWVTDALIMNSAYMNWSRSIVDIPGYWVVGYNCWDYACEINSIDDRLVRPIGGINAPPAITVIK